MLVRFLPTHHSTTPWTIDDYLVPFTWLVSQVEDSCRNDIDLRKPLFRSAAAASWIHARHCRGTIHNFH
jgi:hypothetical protein